MAEMEGRVGVGTGMGMGMPVRVGVESRLGRGSNWLASYVR